MSNHLASVQLLMQELGPTTPEIDAIIQSDETSWAIQFSDESIIIIDWADAPPRLVISATLGRPAEESRLAVYRTMLSYNLLWKDTGGVKAALAGPMGDVILLVDLYADQLYEAELRTVLLNFVQLALVWSSYVTNQDGATADVPLAVDNMHLRA